MIASAALCGITTAIWNFTRQCLQWVQLLHTLNIRLSPTDLEYIINHAADKVIFVDEDLLPLLEPLKGKLPSVEKIIICRYGDGGESSYENQQDYEEFIAGKDTVFNWPEIDETSPMGLCYTSGTTGKPKGCHVYQSLDLPAYAD